MWVYPDAKEILLTTTHLPQQTCKVTRLLAGARFEETIELFRMQEQRSSMPIATITLHF